MVVLCWIDLKQKGVDIRAGRTQLVKIWIQPDFRDQRTGPYWEEGNNKWRAMISSLRRVTLNLIIEKDPVELLKQRKDNEKEFRKIILAVSWRWNWSKKDCKQGSLLNCCCSNAGLKRRDSKLRWCQQKWKIVWFKRFCVFWRLYIKLG